MQIETFEQLINFGAGRQFTVSKAHQRKARIRYLQAKTRMRIYLIILLFVCSNKNFAQSNYDIDRKVNFIDSLLNKGILKSKEYPGRTVVGSLNGYYYNDKLVLIKTLTDGEYGGTETIYYVDNSILIKTFKMGVSFKDPNEWTKYFKSHKQNNNCLKCHNKNNCQKTIIYFESKQLDYYIDDKQAKLTQVEKDLEISNTINIFNLLLQLLQDIK